MDANKFKKYQKTIVENVLAVEYYKGLETGFELRYYFEDEIDENGIIYTSGLIGDKEIKVPVFETEEGDYVLLGNGSILIQYEDGHYSSMYKDEFHKIYKEV